MQLPLQITFRNLERSDAIEAKVRERADELDQFHNHIMSCRVIIEALHKHHRRGNQFHVRVDITAPEGEIIASREPDDHHAYTDVFVAIRDAFDATRRQLEDQVRRGRGQVKAHEVAPHGRVAELNLAGNYGRIETSDGRLVYFHRNSVIDGDFDQLRVGAELRFSEEAGDHGPQASTVHVVGKHHIVG